MFLLKSWQAPLNPPSSPSGDESLPSSWRLLTEDEMDEIRSANPRPSGRLCHQGHRVSGSNAYRRKNGRLECKRCRAAASARYRAKLNN